MSKPILYTAFHLNLAFSSIEEEDRSAVVERCYWPLLQMAGEGLPIGLEVTSFTLLEIQRVDPTWVDRLKELIDQGTVELIASGFCQIIGPLVPAEVTRQNLRLGLEDYEALLGCRPGTALVNEQAYSHGLLPLYKEAGFEAIMMDWAEPASHNKNWERAFSQKPHLVAGGEGAVLPVVWSDAISFQKFQRYAHGELTAEEYFGFLAEQISSGASAIPVYTSDAEVFDYRPGRFSSEAELGGISEFERIRLLLKSLQQSDDVILALPKEVLNLVDPFLAPLRLETSAVPVPVKKQRKYNLTRWGLTGRDDLRLNTFCWRLYESLASKGEKASNAEWRQLCQLWASDYRTHITKKRWMALAETLPALQKMEPEKEAQVSELPAFIAVEKVGRFLSLETEEMHLVLNLQRGMAIQSFGYGAAGMALSGKLGEGAAIGTLVHGFFDDIAYGADFYSGHFVLEPTMAHKVTDLVRCDPELSWQPSTRRLKVTAVLEVGTEAIQKTLLVDFKDRSIDIEYDSDIHLVDAASRRLGFVTLNPAFFDAETLFYATHNGGDCLERFPLCEGETLVEVDHGASVSRLVSASSALGMTGGRLYIGDADHYISIEMKRRDCAGLGMVTCAPVRGSFFVRGYVSVGEWDETSRFDPPNLADEVDRLVFKVSLSLGETSKLLE